MAELKISLLGSFQAALGGEPVTSFRSNKVRALLAYLCIERDQPHQREKLAGLFWPELPENAARTNLRHSLSNLRTAIGDREREKSGSGPLLQITPQSIGFFPDPSVDIDISRFLALTETNPVQEENLQQLEEAVSLYKSELLDGFSLPDCSTFEEWLILERERFQIRYNRVLQRLGEIYRKQGNIEQALDCARRQLSLNPYHEKAHRQVMELLWISGRAGEAAAQYDACRQILESELGVEPSQPTRDLFIRIREGDLPPLAALGESALLIKTSPPEFLSADEPPARPLFLGREKILQALEDQLASAIDGQVQITFIAGEAGSGKTALLNHFITQAVDHHPHLLAVRGSCSTFLGIGDPYLPFREAFNQLCGNLEPYWKAGSITSSQARKIWEAMPLITWNLIEFGSDLFGPLVNGQALYSRLKSAVESDDMPLLNHLSSRISHPNNKLEEDENFLVEQTVNVLRKVSSKHPLLWVLDDIHWIDIPSCSLLFALGRKIQPASVMIICAYRPEEIPDEHRGKPHPLRKLLTEFKRRFGDVWINLNEHNLAGGQQFTHSIIDTEPNQLDDQFRKEIFLRTSGNPLFTIELLRSMQTRGDIRLNASGEWITGPILRWDYLPAKVEAAIEDRVTHLPPQLQEILSIASIEGESFTPRVIAKVGNLDWQETLKILSNQLEKKHRVVRFQGEINVNKQTLPRFQFSHGLFHAYIYNNLEDFHKRELHLAVGNALEEIYGDEIEDIAAQLAAHFDSDHEKARYYHKVAGQVAVERYATEQGIEHIDRALELTNEADLDSRYELLLLRTRAHTSAGNLKPGLADIPELYSIAEKLEDKFKIAETALEESRLALFGDDSKRLVEVAKKAEKIAKEINHLEFEVLALRQWGRGLQDFGKYSLAEKKLLRGLELAYKLNDPLIIAEISRNINTLYLFSGQIDKAWPYLETALEIYRRKAQPKNEVKVLASLGHYHSFNYDYQQAISSLEKLIELSRKIGWRFYERVALTNLGSEFEEIGLYDQSIECSMKAFHLADEDDHVGMKISTQGNIGCALLGRNEIKAAIQKFEAAKTMAKELNIPYLHGFILTFLAKSYLLGGNAPKAYQISLEAQNVLKNITRQKFSLMSRAIGAEALLELGDIDASYRQVEEILEDVGTNLAELRRVDLPIILTCYKVLSAKSDPRANPLLETGYRILMERADKFTNPEYQASYLENLAENAELRSIYQTQILENMA